MQGSTDQKVGPRTSEIFVKRLNPLYDRKTGPGQPHVALPELNEILA